MARVLLVLALAALLVIGGAAPAGAESARTAVDPGESTIETFETWRWPVSPVQIAKPFVAPPHAYGPGHRGIDLRAAGVVTAPASGVIAFAGVVVDRPLVTIAHPGGLVTTLEPVLTPLRPGTPVIRGMPIGVIAVGGHPAPGTVHFGVRLSGEYINPMLLLGGVPRAVLLPCC